MVEEWRSKKPLARLAVTSPFVPPVDGSSPDRLDSGEQETSSDVLITFPISDPKSREQTDPVPIRLLPYSGPFD